MWARPYEGYEGYRSIILSEDTNIIDNSEGVNGTGLLLYIKGSHSVTLMILSLLLQYT